MSTFSMQVVLSFVDKFIRLHKYFIPEADTENVGVEDRKKRKCKMQTAVCPLRGFQQKTEKMQTTRLGGECSRGFYVLARANHRTKLAEVQKVGRRGMPTPE